jgi:hypothetical protein
VNDSDVAATGKKQIDQNEGEVLKELQSMRSTFERFIETFESSLKVSNAQSAQQNQPSSSAGNKLPPVSPTITQQQQFAQQNDSSKTQNMFQAGGHREFDPLAAKKCKRKVVFFRLNFN